MIYSRGAINRRMAQSIFFQARCLRINFFLFIFVIKTRSDFFIILWTINTAEICITVGDLFKYFHYHIRFIEDIMPEKIVKIYVESFLLEEDSLVEDLWWEPVFPLALSIIFPISLIFLKKTFFKTCVISLNFQIKENSLKSLSYLLIWYKFAHKDSSDKLLYSLEFIWTIIHIPNF